MEKILSVYWFAILLIVAGGIVAMVLIFYGKPYDVRELEANALMNQVADCISTDGEMAYPLSELETNFLENCHINFKTENAKNQFYLALNFYDFNNIETEVAKGFYEGNPNLKGDLIASSLFANEKSFYVLNKDGEQPKEIVVKMLVIIDKNGENA